MQIKLIYEDEAVLSVKEQIARLDTDQLFFVEQFIKQTRETRKQQIFEQWQHTLQDLVNNA